LQREAEEKRLKEEEEKKEKLRLLRERKETERKVSCDFVTDIHLKHYQFFSAFYFWLHTHGKACLFRAMEHVICLNPSQPTDSLLHLPASEGCKAELIWIVGFIPRWLTYPKTDTGWTRHRATALIGQTC